MTSALPADTRVERVIVHGGGDDMPPLKGTTLVPWSRAAEFATRVFADPATEAPEGTRVKPPGAAKKGSTPRNTTRAPVRKEKAKVKRARR
jgi:hypothetical protein